jgi:integrase
LTPAQARKKATELLAKVKLGGDPATEKRERREKDSLSLRGVINQFLSHKTGVRRNTMEALRRYLETGPYLGSLRGMPVDRITRKDVASRLLAVSKDHGVRTALGFRSAVSSLFSWAMQTGLIEHNPIIGAYKPETPKPRERTLSNAELAAIWKNLADDDYGKVVKLLILSGARRDEIGEMRWSEFSPDMTAWALPATRSKNKRAHALPITPLMLEIVESVPHRYEIDLLFGMRGRGFSQWGPGKRALDGKINLPPWQVRDIRRSVSTGMNDIGIMPHVVERILGHSIGGVHATYNRSIYANEVRDAMLRWSTHIAEIIKGGKRKVVAFEQRASASTP